MNNKMVTTMIAIFTLATTSFAEVIELPRVVEQMMIQKNVTCLSVYSDIGATVRPVPKNLQGAKLAFHADLEKRTCEIFVGDDDAKFLYSHLSTVKWSDGNNGVWKEVEVLRGNEWVKTKSCLTPCLVCDCCVCYIPRGNVPTSVEMSYEDVQKFGVDPDQQYFSIGRTVDEPATQFEDGTLMMSPDESGYWEVIATAKRNGFMWSVDILNIEAMQEFVENVKNSEGSCCSIETNGVWTRCRKEIVPGVYTYFNCCAPGCDDMCDCSVWWSPDPFF